MDKRKHIKYIYKNNRDDNINIDGGTQNLLDSGLISQPDQMTLTLNKNELWFPFSVPSKLSPIDSTEILVNLMEEYVNQYPKKSMEQSQQQSPQPPQAIFQKQSSQLSKQITIPKKISSKISIDIKPLIDIYNNHMNSIHGKYNDIIAKLNENVLTRTKPTSSEILEFEPIYLANTVVTYNDNVHNFANLLKNEMDIATEMINKLFENKHIVRLCHI